MNRALAFLLCLVVLPAVAAKDAPECTSTASVDARLEALEDRLSRLADALEEIGKKTDDALWFHRAGDIARIDKVFIPTVPNPREDARYGIANERHPFRMWAYVFIPRALPANAKAPLLVLPHGGVHGDFDTYYTPVIRELMEEGYVVIAPEYRGSSGYGAPYREAIDYGGLEVADCVAARDWAIAMLPEVDPERAGILGWSHGGMIALLAIFDHPDKFKAAYAGVPVSDLVARMGYQTDAYRALFSADHHLGVTVTEDVETYKRRSPAWNAEKLKRPLLIHTTTNDRDVNVIEVEHLIKSLKAAGKDFQYKVYDDAPGGHSFNRMNSPLAVESRREIWAFLRKNVASR